MRAWATQVLHPYPNGPTLPLPTLIAPPLPYLPTLINEQVHDLLASSRDLALEVFISRNLVGFLKEALERVGQGRLGREHAALEGLEERVGVASVAQLAQAASAEADHLGDLGAERLEEEGAELGPRLDHELTQHGGAGGRAGLAPGGLDRLQALGVPARREQAAGLVGDVRVFAAISSMRAPDRPLRANSAMATRRISRFTASGFCFQPCFGASFLPFTGLSKRRLPSLPPS